MPDVIAQGPDPSDRWRRQLPVERAVVVGRHANWSVPWDDRISRAHVELTWNGKTLQVTKLAAAKNPLFYRGDDVPHASLLPGEHFVIGQTTFTLAQERALLTMTAPAPRRERAYSRKELRQLRFRHADVRIDLLSRLPELLAEATNDESQFGAVVNLLLAGIPHAQAAAIVDWRDAEGSTAAAILHWDHPAALHRDFLPSERLVAAAMAARKSVLHVWDRAAATESPFTMQQGVDWAFCTPVIVGQQTSLGLYLAGSRTEAVENTSGNDDDRLANDDLTDDLKFTELVATLLGSVRKVQHLERQRAGLGQFFSPVVMNALIDADAEQVLSPRETEVSVLFCDLRGFSRASEQSADKLFELLERVSQALGVTTRQICEQGGVLGDFHGDAVMGFWGWPLPAPDGAVRAARAALAIRAELANSIGDSAGAPTGPSGFRAGIGIATGMAVAGKIGTSDQVKVTVFGPVVNVAARLESMTEQLHASILVDERTAAILRAHLSSQLGRLRRVARVLPVGMGQPLMVSELLPPADSKSVVDDAALTSYERALDNFLAGDWRAALEQLQRLPPDDRVKDLLTMWIAQHNRTVPPNWQGVIPLATK